MEVGEYGFAGANLLTCLHHNLRVGRQIEVDPRAESDQAEASPSDDVVVRFEPADDASGDETGDLDKSQFLALGSRDDRGAVLVLQGGLVTVGRIELALPVEDLFDLAGGGHPVDMDIEDIHENRDLLRLAVREPGIRHPFDADDLAVGGGHHRIFLIRDKSLGVAKKAEDEEGDEQQDAGRNFHSDYRCEKGAKSGKEDKWVPFLGNGYLR